MSPVLSGPSKISVAVPLATPCLISVYFLRTLPLLDKANCYQQAAIEETKAVFPSLRKRIVDALEKLEEQLEVGEEKGATEQEIAKAKEVIAEAKATAS
jgi:hypothetical protein